MTELVMRVLTYPGLSKGSRIALTLTILQPGISREDLAATMGESPRQVRRFLAEWHSREAAEFVQEMLLSTADKIDRSGCADKIDRTKLTAADKIDRTKLTAPRASLENSPKESSKRPFEIINLNHKSSLPEES
jgi:hypothetical protein